MASIISSNRHVFLKHYFSSSKNPFT